MKKIPCVFQRDFSDKRNPKILEAVTPGCEWVFAGEGIATRKRDGTSCMVRNGELFKRYDAKAGKIPPPGFEACQEADPVTGHMPGWIPVDVRNPDSADVWHALAWWQNGYLYSGPVQQDAGTYELCGPKIGSNHEHLTTMQFFEHGGEIITGETRTFSDLRALLSNLEIEGIVFWREPGNVNGDMAKLTRENFGFAWPVR